MRLLVLAGLVVGGVLGPSGTAMAGCTDSPTYAFTPTTYSVQAGATAVLTVHYTNTCQGSVYTMNYSTGDDTAKAGTDYTATSGVLSFTGTTDDKTISVAVSPGATVGSSFVVQLSPPARTRSFRGYPAAWTATVTITAAPAPESNPGGSSGPAGTGQATCSKPIVSSLDPTGGAAGQWVGISGGAFGCVSQVLFGNTPASTFVVDGWNHITAQAPAGVGGSVDVRAVNTVGISDVNSGDVYTFPPPLTPTTPQPTRQQICASVPSLLRHTLPYAARLLRAYGCRNVPIIHTGHVLHHPAHITSQVPATGAPLFAGDVVVVTVR